jgi:hypothetical protein
MYFNHLAVLLFYGYQGVHCCLTLSSGDRYPVPYMLTSIAGLYAGAGSFSDCLTVALMRIATSLPLHSVCAAFTALNAVNDGITLSNAPNRVRARSCLPVPAVRLTMHEPLLSFALTVSMKK